jgi:hypothetical protein
VGKLNVQNLTNDPFLKDHNIQPIGSRSAATNIGILFWRLIQVKIQVRLLPLSLCSPTPI